MKIPPPNDDHVPTLTLGGAAVVRDRRFLVFAGAILIALSLGFKSELVDPGHAWWLAAGLVAIAAPVILAYLRVDPGPRLPAIEHYVPAVLGALAVAGLSLILPEWWKFALAAAVFGAGFAISARLDYLSLSGEPKRGHAFVQEAILTSALIGGFIAILGSPFGILLKLGWIFTLSALAAFRSFRISGDPIAPRRAFLFSLLVAQVVTFFAFAVSVYISSLAEGIFAVMLLLAWYINRGVMRHTAEESLTRNVVVEYGLFGVVLAFLFAYSYRNPS